jgi:catalase
MEDYIETFLYILVTVIFIIVGSLGKKKRKQVNTKSYNSSSEEPQVKFEQPSNIFDYLNEKINEPLIDTLEEEIEIPAEDEPKIEDEPIEMVENVEQQTFLEPNLHENLMKDSEQVDFDLRRAIIYSEILNRKYS